MERSLMHELSALKKGYLDILLKFVKAKNKKENEKAINAIIDFESRISKELEEMNKIVFVSRSLSDIEHYMDECRQLKSKLTKQDIKSFIIQLKE